MTTWNRDDSDLTTVLGLNSTTVGNIRITGNTIGHSTDTDILTFAETTLDITSPNVDINGNLYIKNTAGDATYVTLSNSGILVNGSITATGTITGVLSTASQPNITTVGTIGTGTWQGTAIANSYIADLPTSKITSGTFDDARISQSSVTQHQASLSIATTQLTGNMPDARITASNITQHQSSITSLGTLTSLNITGAVNVGVDDTGHDVKFFGATSGKYMLWDESENRLIVKGLTDLDGNVEVTGSDFKVNGSVLNTYMLYNNSSNRLELADTTSSANLYLQTISGVGPNAPNIDFYKKSDSSAANDVIGILDFRGRNNANDADVRFAKIEVDVIDSTKGAEEGRLNLGVTANGSLVQEGLVIKGTGSGIVDVDIANGSGSTTTVAGNLTAGSFTTTGSWTFDEHTSGTIDIDTIQDSGTSFANNDTSLLTAAAIEDKIESYSYTTTTGTITSVEVTTDSGSGSRYNQNTGAASFSILGTSGIDVTNSSGTITVTSVPSEIDHDSLSNFAANEHFRQADIVTVSTITTGEWNATPIAHAYIGNDAIEGDNLADNAVDSEHYTDGSIDTAHIADDQVTYAKMQNVSATDRILGRDSSGAGIIEEITPANLKTMLSLNNVENTALSTFAGTSNINTLASSISLGGSPTTTTQSAGDSSTKIATTEFVSTAVSNLVDSSPAALNTLNELAAALGDDANFSTTVTNSIATKAPLASPTFTGTVTMPATIARTGDLTFDVSGDITLDADGGDVTILDSTASGLKPTFTLKSTDSGSYGAMLNVVHESSSPSPGDTMYYKTITGKNDADQDVGYITEESKINSITDGAEIGQYIKYVMSAGTSRNGFQITGSTSAAGGGVNVSLGYGTTSTTTIAGDLTITGGNIKNSTTFDEDLTITTIPEATSDTDKFLVSDSGLIKYVTGADLRTYIGAGTSNLTIGTTGSTAMAGNTVIPAAVTNYVTNDADDEMQGTLTIDKNSTATSSSTTNGIFIDFDHTGVSASGQSVINQGLKIDLNSNSPTHVGSVSNYGIRNTIIAGTSGTQNSYGMIQSVTGGDMNIGIYQTVTNGGSDLVFLDSANANNYFVLKTEANAETTISTNNSSTAGHLNIEPNGHVEFDNCGVGFDLVTPTFNAADTNVNFRTGNKQMVTLTGNIADLNLTFPNTSGNFTLLLKQDGVGSRTIAADGYLVFEHDGTAATVSTVKFAGGSNPTLTTDANHVDIISFFWDADNQVCYGVASLDFQD